MATPPAGGDKPAGRRPPATPRLPQPDKPQTGVRGLWRKMREDWVFNFSGMMAYSYLTSTVPLALVALSTGFLVFNTAAPGVLDGFESEIAGIIPGGEPVVNILLDSLRQAPRNAGILLTVSLIIAFITGSRLFVALENSFSIIYRLGERDYLSQSMVAITMTMFYNILAPLAFIVSTGLASVATSVNATWMDAIVTITGGNAHDALTYVGRLVSAYIISFLTFYIMYVFVPNRPFSWRRTLRISWRGAAVVALLLTLYEQLFPLIRAYFQAIDYGVYSTVTGEAIVAIIFLYIIGFITLLGAEINAWAEGLRPMGVTLPDLFRKQGRLSR